MKILHVLFDGKKIIHGSRVPLSLVQIKPVIDYNPDPNKIYCLMMVDPDAPSKKDPIFKYFLHWLIINISLDAKDIIMDFEPPTPPENSGPHRYCIILFEQIKKINLEPIKERKRFPCASFVKEHDLKPVASLMFVTENKR